MPQSGSIHEALAEHATVPIGKLTPLTAARTSRRARELEPRDKHRPIQYP